MRKDIEERVKEEARYIIRNNATVRNAAKYFKVSKSTIHKDVTERLKRIDRSLYNRTYRVLSVNKAQRHFRGGMATKLKYEALAKEKKKKA